MLVSEAFQIIGVIFCLGLIVIVLCFIAAMTARLIKRIDKKMGWY